ncbi:energy-coupling factor ABC transporter ATP-binding protein [Desulfosarcina ovata]|uniref:Energy-coupling factor ABC transporter ATP-binding protein n=1 Tax=Desulfosarcina ovata subsp. ovata TaxID=2752305 RepID=A0A5K8ABI2_9BACT|nr:ABC transporter ATP-binding protein [Desulfosarcina ovata]BBO89947.1 energy-coupling factor ABC transporter ATP-binding protein [Desulfosarcina ovata subsp. ovata]
MHPVILNLTDISYGYPGGPSVLDHLNFQLHIGDRIGLVAPNGSGKTTLFHIIMGLLKPMSGTVEVFGTARKTEADFVDVRRRIGLLFQDADDQLFSPTVLEDVAFGPLNLGKTREEAVEVAKRTLDFLGLAGFEERITYKLSGGEKRLVSLATVLAMEPEVLLLDEPSTGLDNGTKDALIHVLNSLELTFVLISHEFGFLSQTARHIYTMKSGRIRFDQELPIHTHKHAHLMGRQPHRHV